MTIEKWVFKWRRKVCSDDDETTASGRLFQNWAAATGKARLPTVDSLCNSLCVCVFVFYFLCCLCFYQFLCIADVWWVIIEIYLQYLQYNVEELITATDRENKWEQLSRFTGATLPTMQSLLVTRVVKEGIASHTRLDWNERVFVVTQVICAMAITSCQLTFRFIYICSSP